MSTGVRVALVVVWFKVGEFFSPRMSHIAHGSNRLVPFLAGDLPSQPESELPRHCLLLKSEKLCDRMSDRKVACHSWKSCESNKQVYRTSKKPYLCEKVPRNFVRRCIIFSLL